MKILTGQQLHEADRQTLAVQGIQSIDLMERAAVQLFDWLNKHLMLYPAPVKICCGVGNNGGDGLALARMLLEGGHEVTVYIAAFSEKCSDCFTANLEQLKKTTGAEVHVVKNTKNFPKIKKIDLVVDALFGIGLNRPVTGWVKELIAHINRSGADILAVDMPSGLFTDAPTPDMEAVIQATHTLTFQTPKLAFFLPETGPFCGNVEVLDIGLDEHYIKEAPSSAETVEKSDVTMLLRPRKKFTHKGDYGHALMAGGSYGMMGAVVLAAKACLRAGAGRVTALVPSCGYDILQTAVPEAMVIADERDEKYLDSFEYGFEPTAVGAGIGLGMAKDTQVGFKDFLSRQKKPVVLDADALNVLAGNPDTLRHIPKSSVLTPHPGELRRLIGEWGDDFDMLDKAASFAKKHKIILVVKGAHTITIQGEKRYVNTTGNPGMATAGSGDVLTGIITGLLAQSYAPLHAAVLGVYLHGKAGDLAVRKKGEASLVAGDIVAYMGKAIMQLKNNQYS